jgi:hypothetical protein
MFKQDLNAPVEKSHPLIKLIPAIEDNNWQQQLKTLPLDKLKQISQLLNQVETEE